MRLIIFSIPPEQIRFSFRHVDQFLERGPILMITDGM